MSKSRAFGKGEARLAFAGVASLALLGMLVLSGEERHSAPGILIASLPQYSVSSSNSVNTDLHSPTQLVPIKVRRDVTILSAADAKAAGDAEDAGGGDQPSSPGVIVREGNVEIRPAGCADCPVLDTNAVMLQKEKIRENQQRIDRLRRMMDANKEKIRQSSESLKFLKQVIASAVFNMKEEIKKVDVDMESKMLAAEQDHGPPGDRGVVGYNGIDGRPGRPGEAGANGRPGKQGEAGEAGAAGPRGPVGVKGSPGLQGREGEVGAPGRAGNAGLTGLRGQESRSVDCARLGGQMFKGVCLKASVLSHDEDSVPSMCSIYLPAKRWTEKDWWELSRMFKDRPGHESSRIDRDRDGGRCNNHGAVMSFAEGSSIKTWVNSKVFAFAPTDRGGETCKLYNGHGTVALYACTV